MVLSKLASIASLHRGYRRHESRPSTGSHSAASAAGSLSHADDIITPAPPVPTGPDCTSHSAGSHISHHLRQRHPGPRPQRPRSDLLSSRRSSIAMEGSPVTTDPHWQLDLGSWSEDEETERLWRRMLELQRHFRCYNSARMDAAVDDENMSAIVPPRSCLDLLNDSIGALPEEAQRELDNFLERLDGPARRKHRIWGIPVGISY